MSTRITKRPVLVVEENLVIRERLYDVLTRHGHAVLTVNNAERAINALQQEHPCVMLSNPQLSDMDGAELARRVRAIDPRMPIILFGDNPGTPADARQACLPASTDPDTLLKTIDRLTSEPESAKPERWPANVLVVDDDPRCCFLLQEFLDLQGLHVTVVGSGEEGLRQLEQSTFQVVLLDISMQGMDGLLTLKKIKALRPGLTVIMITGFEEEQMINQAMELGAADYVTKPFDRAYLETTLLSKILLGRAS